MAEDAVVLSVVIPTYDTAALTLECCRAVLASLPEESEVIVVDDASHDGTAALLRAEVPAVTVLRLETNRRFAGAARAGVDASRGAIVLLLNSDTRVEPEALTAFLAAFRDDPRLGVAGGTLLNPDGTAQWSGGPIPTLLWLVVMVSGVARFLPRREREVGRGGDREVAWVSGAAMAFRRELWSVAGPLREHYRFYAQDLDFCIRAGDAGWSVRIVRDARVLHEGGATVRRWRDVAELPHDPALLWLDLLTWGRGRYGRGWAFVARAAMGVVALARVTARRLGELRLRGAARQRARSVTTAYAKALRQLLVERDQAPR